MNYEPCAAGQATLGSFSCATCPLLPPNLRSSRQIETYLRNLSPFVRGPRANPAISAAELNAPSNQSYCGSQKHIVLSTLVYQCYADENSRQFNFANPYGFTSLSDGPSCFQRGKGIGTLIGATVQNQGGLAAGAAALPVSIRRRRTGVQNQVVAPVVAPIVQPILRRSQRNIS